MNERELIFCKLFRHDFFDNVIVKANKIEEIPIDNNFGILLMLCV